MSLPAQIDREVKRAMAASMRHEAECSICVEEGSFLRPDWHRERCALGAVLMANFAALYNLREEPSRWLQVEVIARPEEEATA